MRNEAVRRREARLQLIRHEPAEISPRLDRRNKRRDAALHQPVDQERTIVRLFQQRRAPEVLFHLLSPDEDDLPDAQRRELRQEPLQDARTRRRKDKIDPRTERLAVVADAHPDRLAQLQDLARADLAVDFARLQDLPDFAMQDAADVLGARTAEDGDAVRDFSRLEKNAIHAFFRDPLVLRLTGPVRPTEPRSSVGAWSRGCGGRSRCRCGARPRRRRQRARASARGSRQADRARRNWGCRRCA